VTCRSVTNPGGVRGGVGWSRKRSRIRGVRGQLAPYKTGSDAMASEQALHVLRASFIILRWQYRGKKQPRCCNGYNCCNYCNCCNGYNCCNCCNCCNGCNCSNCNCCNCCNGYNCCNYCNCWNGYNFCNSYNGYNCCNGCNGYNWLSSCNFKPVTSGLNLWLHHNP